MRGFRPGLYGLTALLLAAGACTAAETDAAALSGNTAMSDATAPTGQDAALGPDTVSGLWALHASDAPEQTSCRIALQKTGQDGIYGVYLQGCESTVLARVAGWRILEDTVALLDAGGEPVLRFRKTAMNRMEANSGSVTYRLEPAAMM